MKDKILRKENVILAAFAAQMVFLLVFNLTQTRYMVNMDSSEYLVQVMQIAKQGTLLIDHYCYSTALMWDMPTILAVPFYALTKDVFLSWGIAVDLYLILFALILRKLTRDLKLSDAASYIVLLMAFTMYAHGLVDYGDMLLINGATYLVRILLLMTLLDVSICLKAKPGPAEKPEIALLVIGLFICGISTGIFAVGCIIAPVALYEFLHIICRREKIEIRKEKGLCLALMLTVISLLGVAANKLLGLPASQESSKMLTHASQLAGQALANLAGIFALFGWPDADTALLSADGLAAICGAVVALALIVSFFTAIRSAAQQKWGDTQSQYVWMAACILIVNFALFTFVDLSYGGGSCEYRYWLLVMVPAMPVCGLVIDGPDRGCTGMRKRPVLAAALLVLLAINVYRDKDLMDYAASGRPYAAVNQAAMELASENEVDVLYLYTDYYWGRQMAAYAPVDMEVMAVADDTEDGLGNWTMGRLSMPRWGTYVRYDGSSEENTKACEGKRTAVLMDVKSAAQREYLEGRAEEILPLGSVKGAKKLDDRFELVIFEGNENPMDFTGAND